MIWLRRARRRSARRVAEWVVVVVLGLLTLFVWFCIGALLNYALAMAPHQAPAAMEIGYWRTLNAILLLERVPFRAPDEMLAAPPPIRVHGDAQWIQNGNYRAQSGEHCCGVSDCGPVPVQDIRHVIDGYEVRGVFVPMAQTLPSTDGQYWACVKPGGIRCFFAPLMG